MKSYIFTFGQNHAYKDGYVTINANSPELARAEMFKRYGQKWSMQYLSKEQAEVEKFHLYQVEEITVETQCE